MLIVADIGNSNIKFGVFGSSADELLYHFSLSSHTKRTADEYALLIKSFLSENSLYNKEYSCVISSVVPSLTPPVIDAFKTLFCTEPFIIGTGTHTGFPIKIDAQSQLGADIVSNAAASFNICKAPFAVVDVGTATTITCVDSKGCLVGTVIAPGAFVSLEALKSSCALLNEINFDKPDVIIGKNSQESIKSGVFWGQVYAIDGFISKIRNKLCADGSTLSLVGTGGLAAAILGQCSDSYIIDPYLTLKGAAALFYMNTSRRKSNYTK